MPCGVGRGTHRSWILGEGVGERLGARGVREAGQGLGGGCKGEQISQRVSYFLSFLTRTKRRNMAFFEGCPVGWGGYPSGLVDGG